MGGENVQVAADNELRVGLECDLEHPEYSLASL